MYTMAAVIDNVSQIKAGEQFVGYARLKTCIALVVSR